MIHRFGGETFDAILDGGRLSAQHERVLHVVRDGQWRTLADISARTGDPEPSVSARLRDLRKPQFGSLTVERRRVPDGDGLHEYRVFA